MSDSKCSFCLSEADDRRYLTSDDGTACVCSNCAMMLTQYVLQEQEEESENLGDDNINSSPNNSELDELCDAIGDKLMETGYLTSAVEDGDLATVSINVEGDESLFRINIYIQADNRASDSLSPDEEENICDTFDTFLDERSLKGSFAELGFDIDGDFEGYYAHLLDG